MHVCSECPAVTLTCACNLMFACLVPCSVRFLKKFKRLEELILDHNELTDDRFKLPAMPMFA